MTSMIWRLAYFEQFADPVAEDILSAAPGVELIRLSSTDDETTTAEKLSSAHGYQLFGKTEMPERFWPSRSFIEQCPNLVAISALGAGYDAVDMDAAKDHSIIVVNNSGANSDSVAQHAIGMVLALGKNMIRHDRMMRDAPGLDRMASPGLEATDKTLGIVGLGNIGRRTAKIAKHALGMRVIAVDPYITDQDFIERDAEKADFETVFSESDFISVHCPLTEETRGMIGVDAYNLMKPSAYFITTARGRIHDEAALVEALAQNKINGAGVDVFDQEPPGPGHPLMAFQNVLMTPHSAGVTDVCNYNMAKWGAEQWVDIIAGRRPPRLVNPDVWDAYVQRHTQIIGHAPAA